MHIGDGDGGSGIGRRWLSSLVEVAGGAGNRHKVIPLPGVWRPLEKRGMRPRNVPCNGPGVIIAGRVVHVASVGEGWWTWWGWSRGS